MPQFVWSFDVNYKCDTCDYENMEKVNSDVLFAIPSSNIINFSGLISDAIKASLSGYVGQCPNYHSETIVEKSVSKIPNYYCCTLEYAEDIQKGSLNIDLISEITLEESFKFDNILFNLAAIIYFQKMHYTAHVKGIRHPKFLPKREIKWFYHDGYKTSCDKGTFIKGLLFESQPKFNVNLCIDELKPYILIYKVFNDSN